MTALHSADQTGQQTIRLGLIGSNIRQSRSPDLHRLCGELTGLDVSYELLVPAELGMDFNALLDSCARSGMRGVNITYPYKERAIARVGRLDPGAAEIGSVNTVVFEAAGTEAFNTDFSGFITAYRRRFGATPPGRVAIVGAGGVGRAIAFALAELDAAELRLIDSVPGKAEALAGALSGAHSRLTVTVARNIAEAVPAAEGIVNATPIGMAGHGGTPVPRSLLGGQRWAFDAVYTPPDTVFAREAGACGIAVLGGYALFLHQGIDAFRLFTGRSPDDLGVLEQKLLLPARPGDR